MNGGSWYRRVVTAGVVAALAATGLATLVTSAAADTPEVALTVTPATATNGTTVTVTETVTNIHGFTVLHPTAELFTSPDAITGYTTLTGCNAGPGGSCGTTTNGGLTGYQAIFGQALSGNTSMTATFTFTIDPSDTTSAVETLEGALVGLNYATPVVPGPTLTVTPQADLAVAMTGQPHSGLLSLTLVFTVTVTNNGPGALRTAQLTATVPQGLEVESTSTCQANGSGAVCTVGSVPPGGTATAKFGVPIGLLDIGIPFQFTVTRTSSTPVDPNPANDSASVTCDAVSVLLASCSPAS